MENKKSQGSYQKLTILLLIALILMLGGTYAWLTLSLTGTKTNNIVVGNLSLKLKDDTTNGISIDNAYPVSDNTGLTNNPYVFSLTNDGEIESTYTVYLDDEEITDGSTRMNDDYIKYSLTKNGIRENSKFLSSIKTTEGRVLDTGKLAVGQSIDYELRLWIAEEVSNDVMSTTFSGRIRIEAEQIKE